MAKVLPTMIHLTEACIISAWRDHTLLVHTGRDTWQLIHTLNNHRLAVNYARFYDKQKFITSSLDRTVVISQFEDSEVQRKIETIRTVHLGRTHAVDIEVTSQSKLVISTSDRQVLMYDITTGDLLHAYKTADSSELITLGNIGLSNTLTFPPLMKVRTLGSPVPQGQIRPRSLLAGAGNDKVSSHLNYTNSVHPYLRP
jgi:WD40 repeat protein